MKIIVMKIMSFGIIIITLISEIPCNAQTNNQLIGTTHEVSPAGTYKQINVTRDNEAVQNLLDTNYSNKQNLIDSIIQNANTYNPTVLGALAYELYHRDSMEKSIFWYYIAVIRARYDANRCADNTVAGEVSTLREVFGTEITAYAFAHKDLLSKNVNEAIDYVKNNEELYDQRWINLGGLDAFNESFGNSSDTTALSKPKKDWPSIKKETLDTFNKGFQEVLKNK